MRKLYSVELVESLIAKLSNEMAKLLRDCFKETECGICVQPELSECMPLCSLVQKPEQHLVERFREETFKCGNGALDRSGRTLT
jgi:hypothetical protein